MKIKLKVYYPKTINAAYPNLPPIWYWDVVDLDRAGLILDLGSDPTHAQALTRGMAALEHAIARQAAREVRC